MDQRARENLPFQKPTRREWWISILSSAALTTLIFLPVVLLTIEHITTYGLFLFGLIPAMAGFFAAFFVNSSAPRKLKHSFQAMLGSMGLICLGLLLYAYEGLICLVMAAPLILICGFIGVLVGHEIQEFRWVRKYRPPMLLSVFALLPLAFIGEVRLAAAPTEDVVTNSVIISASPEAIWPYLSNLPDLPEPDELLFESGIAHPTSTRTVGSGVGAARYCELSTGSMQEIVEEWIPAKVLQFRVLDTPASMKEMNPFGEVNAPHLKNYFQCRRGRFTLTPLPGGRTRLTGTSWYQYRIFPAGYWGLWTDKIVSDVQMRVMREIKRRAER